LLHLDGNNGGVYGGHQSVLLALVGRQADVTKVIQVESCSLAETSLLIVRLLAAATVTDDGIAFANRTSA